MSDTKTFASDVDVDAFLAKVEPQAKRDDALTIAAMMERIAGVGPRMWGPSMVGYGSYHYKYESGREGDAFRLGFSPRKDALTLYVLGCDGGSGPQQALLDRLGKHKTGKACLYIKKLADVDVRVLEELVRLSWDEMAMRYPG